MMQIVFHMAEAWLLIHCLVRAAHNSQTYEKNRKSHPPCAFPSLSHAQTLQSAPMAERACVSLNSGLRCQTQLMHFEPEGELKSTGLRWTFFNETFKMKEDEGWEEGRASGGRMQHMELSDLSRIRVACKMTASLYLERQEESQAALLCCVIFTFQIQLQR